MSTEALSQEDSVSVEMRKNHSNIVSDSKSPDDNADVLDPLDFGSKKKKKKSKPIDLNELDSIKKESTNDPLLEEFNTKKKKKVVITEENADELADQLDAELSFDMKKKKKKPKAVLDELTTDIAQPPVESPTSEISDSPVYTYDMLLTRVYTQMGVQNPELVSGKKRRLTVVPPSMARLGSKKSVFINFATVCNQLNRDSAHLTAYINAELGTRASVDANGALIIRGRYVNKDMEPVLRSYCRNYVLCGTCHSPETDLCKDSRLLFLNCRRCGSRITVKNVTSGFQAVTGRRAAIRAKAQYT